MDREKDIFGLLFQNFCSKLTCLEYRKAKKHDAASESY